MLHPGLLQKRLPYPALHICSGTLQVEDRGRHSVAVAQAASCPPEISGRATQRRGLRLVLAPPLSHLTQLHTDSLWQILRIQPHHLQRQWLEHLYRNAKSESPELDSVASHVSAASPSSTDPQLARPTFVDHLPVFGGCPEGDRDPDFYANVGSAIRTLREDIPNLFQKDLSYDIYRPDIVFRDPKNQFSGIKNYKTIFWSLRFHGTLFFSSIWVDIKRLWQPDDRTLRMRWTVVGRPRVPWDANGVFNGVSNFKLDKRGKIYEHQVDNIILGDPPRSAIFAGLQLLTGGQASRQPVPNMCRAHGSDSRQPGSAQQYSASMHVRADQHLAHPWTASSDSY